MIRRFVTVLLLCLLIGFWVIPSAFSGEGFKLSFNGQEEEFIPEETPNFFKDLEGDFLSLLHAPFIQDRKSLGISLGISAGIGALMFLDEDIQATISKNRSSTSDQLADVVRPLGSGFVVLPLAATFYTSGRLLNNEKARETGIHGYHYC